jgi:hypothetical protein
MHTWLLMSMGIFIGALGAGLVVWLVLRQHRSGQATASASDTTATQASEPAPPTTIEWELGGTKLWEVTHFVPTPDMVREEMPLDPRLREGLQTLFHGAPKLATPQGEGAPQTNHYLLRFSSQVSQGIIDGTLKMMSLMKGGLYGKVVDTRNRILQHATLDAVGSVTSAASAVWQVMAFVTSQKFLSDINERLDTIEKSIAGMKQWLETERVGQLQGNLTYLKHLSQALCRCNITEDDAAAFCTQVENIERECCQVMATVDAPLECCVGNIQQQPLSGSGLKEHSRAAQELVDTFKRNSQVYLLAAYVRGAVIQLRTSLPVSKQVAQLSLEELSAEFRRHTDRQQKFISTVECRIPELKGAWSWASTDEEHQNQLRGLLKDTQCCLDQASSTVAEAVQTLEQQFQELLAAKNKPLELVATLDNAGQLVQLERLVQAAA